MLNKYYQAVTNRSGDALPGYYVRLFDSEGNQVTLYADDSLTPIISVSGKADAAAANDNGMVSFWHESGIYDVRYFDTNDEFRDSEPGVPLFRGLGETDLPYVKAEDYGASVDISDNSGALTDGAAAAAERGVDFVMSANYPCTDGVTIPANVCIRGIGKEASGIISSAVTAVNVVGGGAEFHDMAIVCTGSQRVAIASIDDDAPTLTNCRIDGRSYFLNSLDEEKRGPVISGCDIHCDFEDDFNGTDQYDVVSIYGFYGPKIIGNNFIVNNVHRLVKCTDITTVTDPAQVVSAYNTRGFVFSDNSVKGIGGKQVFDLYSGTSGVHITDNHFELSDDATISGNRWTSVIESKCAANQRDVYDIGAAIVIQGNEGYIGRCPFVRLEGSYGITQVGFTGNRWNTVKLVDNDIRRTVDNANPMIDIRFFNEVVSSNNSWQIPPGTANRAVVGYYSNQIVCANSDTHYGGCIEVASQTSNLSGLTFNGAIGTVDLDGCSVVNFDANGAVRLLLIISAEFIQIEGLKSRPQTGPSTPCRAVYCESNTAITQLDIINCNATHPSGGNVAPVLDSAATLAKQRIMNNNWQPRFKGMVTSLPGTMTTVRGDWLAQIAPSIGAPVLYAAHTAGNPGGYRAVAWMVGSGTTAQRPSSLGANDVGVNYLDTTLAAAGKPITWTGTQWVDATGTVV